MFKLLQNPAELLFILKSQNLKQSNLSSFITSFLWQMIVLIHFCWISLPHTFTITGRSSLELENTLFCNQFLTFPSLPEAVCFLFRSVVVSSLFKTQFCYTLSDFLEEQKRVSRERAFFCTGKDCLSRPIIWCYIGRACVCGRLRPNLSLQVRLSEGEQELLDVFGAQTVDAARVDGPAQELIHLVLWVKVFLRVSENEMPE